MEWTLEVNDMFKEDITKITNSLIPPDFVGDGRSIRTMQESLKRVIDQIGMLSAQAQGLSKVITTADKMRAADSHTLYLYKDAAANKGAGLVLGMLKVGRKHLFLFDESERVREVEPLCVLDFYVRDDYQRHGIGKALFDHMLQDQGTTAHRLAVDGPSEQMAEFLRKNYGVTCLLRQTNNFAVSPIFFEEMLPADEHGTNVLAQGSRAAAGCFTAHSPIANVIHGGGTPSGTQNNFWTGDDKGRRHMTSCSYSPSASYALRPAVHKTGFCEESAGERASPAAPASPPAAGGAAGGEARLRPRTLPVSAAAATPAATPAPPPQATPTPTAAASRLDSQLTDKGFFDVKFYHKKLW